jgi:hypothetical protein
MYTLVLAEELEQEKISSNVDRFSSNFYNDTFPYYFLVFDNGLKGSSKAVCYFIFPRQKKITAFHVLWCEKTKNIIEILNSKYSREPHLWVTSLATKIEPNFGNDPTVTWYYYLKKDVDEVLFEELMKRGNGTALSAKYLNVYLVWATIEMSSNRTRYDILIHDKTTRFLSCFSKPKLTFSMYVSPFRKEVWILIGACCSLIAVLTSVYNKKLKLSKSFSPFFFFVSTLVEEPYSVPTFLWNNRFFKTLTLTWLLTAIIFTNLYVGLMISDVTTPLQGDILSDFDQVLDTEKVYAKMSTLPAEEIANYWRVQMVRFYPAVAIEKELIACERSILMGDTEELHYELSYLKVNYPKKGFYLSKETFETGWSTPVIWSFSNMGMSRIPMYFQFLIEAGIHNALMGLRKDKHYLIRRAGSKYVHESLTEAERIVMEGSIQTIFIILIFFYQEQVLCLWKNYYSLNTEVSPGDLRPNK